MRRLLLILAVSTLSLAGATLGFASATPLSYQITGSLSGTIGTTTFTDSSFSLTGLGDPAGVFSVGPGVFLNPLESVTLNISGIGSSDAVDKFYIFVNQGASSAGLIDFLNGDVFDFSSTAFSSWDGVSPLNPVSVDELFLAPFETTAGTVDFSSAHTLSFKVSQNASVTPEPPTFVLFATGLVAFFLLSRR